jgi:carbamate kinase
MSRIVIALGGNALGANLSDQMKAVRKTSRKIAELIKDGHEVVLTHGNGPQVGLMLDCFDSYKVNHDIDAFTMSVCVSITQGYIGYDLQNFMREALLDIGLSIPVSTVITQVIVDKDDPAFSNPTKPIGLFLNEAQAQVARAKGEDIVKIDKRGYRQVVASPMPQHIVESATIKTLLDAGQLVIACGGGGIPVIEQGNHLKGVQAVIDKDFSSAKLAKLIHADYFVILTAVEKVYIDFCTPEQSAIDTMTCKQAQEHIENGHFGKGSMLPKVQAAMQVVKQTPSCTALITSLEGLLDGLDGMTGTRITP